MAHKIYHLLYRSAASAYIGDSLIQEILERSRVNNAMRNITGLLIYRSGHFIQLLEGKRADVELTYKKILKDSRHTDAKTLVEFESESAIFPDWDMGFVKDEKITSDLSRAIDQLTSEASLAPASKQAIIQALRRFNRVDPGEA